MHARFLFGVLGQQGISKGLQGIGKLAIKALQVAFVDRMQLTADKVQAGARWCQMAEKCPGVEKIQAKTKAAFANDNRNRPCLLQQVVNTRSRDKNMAAFGNRVAIGKINIPIIEGSGASPGIPFDAGIAQAGSLNAAGTDGAYLAVC